MVEQRISNVCTSIPHFCLQLQLQTIGLLQLLPVFKALIWGKPLNSGFQNLALRNQKHRTMAWCKAYLEPFRRGSRVWETDGRTHRHSSNRYCTSVRCAAKNWIYRMV